MNIFKYFLLILFMLLNFSANAIEYYCPKLPIENQIGTYTKEGWLVWPLNETINFKNKYYYKLFSKTYFIKYWTAFPSGKRTGSVNKKKYYIGCCYLIKKEKKRVCAFKNISEENCKPQLPSAPPVKYVCTK